MSDATPETREPTSTGASLPRLHLHTDPPPHWHGAETVRSATWTWIAAASLPLFAAIATHGTDAIRILLIAVATAVAAEAGLGAVLSRQAVNGRFGAHADPNAILRGMLAALTLPPTADWKVTMTAALLTSIVGCVLAGGHGNYLWHPVALGRVGVELLLGPTLPDAAGPPNTLLPVQQIQALVVGANPFGHDAPAPVTALIRDYLPAWDRTLWGMPEAGAGLLGGCGVALLAAALVLVWRGHMRKSCMIAAFAAAAAMAFVLPIRGGGRLTWLPGLVVEDGLPVGLVYVLYQLTTGELMLVILLLAGDSVSSPLTSRGQRRFGLGLGALVIALRNYGLTATAGYWALLIMNTLVPLIDRCTKRRVYGTCYTLCRVRPRDGAETTGRSPLRVNGPADQRKKG